MVQLFALAAQTRWLEFDSWNPGKKPDAVVFLYNPDTPMVRQMQREWDGSSHKRWSGRNRRNPASKARCKESRLLRVVP